MDFTPVVEQALRSTQVIDIHTHLFPPSFGEIGSWGIDSLVTYHYLEAELFRSCALEPEQYWAMSKLERADTIWRALFVENAPVSEATRGVIAVLQALGVATDRPDLSQARDFFASQTIETYLPKVMQLAGVSDIVMTNDPLDPAEAPFWEQHSPVPKQLHPVLRIDRILNKWPEHWQAVAAKGYAVDERLSGRSIAEVRRFLNDWVALMKPIYMACSLPDTFQYPEESLRGTLLKEAAIPACREFNLPLSLMIGVRYLVNPRLRLAGDAVGRADLRALEHIAVTFPKNRFLVSLLSRENQHELCVYARKFNNLMPFGCWWFLNQPSIVEEMTRERIEMLGMSFIPQHSDARILDQLIYKWRNTRRTLTPILANTYRLLAEDGRTVTQQQIEADVNRLFRTNFENFANLRRDKGAAR